MRINQTPDTYQVKMNDFLNVLGWVFFDVALGFGFFFFLIPQALTSCTLEEIFCIFPFDLLLSIKPKRIATHKI